MREASQRFRRHVHHLASPAAQRRAGESDGWRSRRVASVAPASTCAAMNFAWPAPTGRTSSHDTSQCTVVEQENMCLAFRPQASLWGHMARLMGALWEGPATTCHCSSLLEAGFATHVPLCRNLGPRISTRCRPSPRSARCCSSAPLLVDRMGAPRRQRGLESVMGADIQGQGRTRDWAGQLCLGSGGAGYRNSGDRRTDLYGCPTSVAEGWSMWLLNAAAQPMGCAQHRSSDPAPELPGRGGAPRRQRGLGLARIPGQLDGSLARVDWGDRAKRAGATRLLCARRERCTTPVLRRS